MDTLLTWFWTAMVFLAITWYAVMLVYVGIKGGYEILRLTRDLSKNTVNEQNDESP